MMQRRFFLKTLVGAAGGLGSTALLASRPKTALKMGVFPRRNAKATFRLFSPMAAYLSSRLGIEVELVIEKDFAAFWQSIKQKRYDLVHFNQYHYVVAHRHFGYKAILMNQEHGESTVAGCIIVRKDSGINSVTDLAGKIVSFGGGPRAMQSYIIASGLLKEGGLTKDMYSYKFAINPPNAIISTFKKQVDAAGSGDVVLNLNAVKSKIDISQMKYLIKSEPTAHLPWATSAGLPDALRMDIKSILLGLQTHISGLRILKRAELSALVPAKDSDYNASRDKVVALYGDDYGFLRLQ